MKLHETDSHDPTKCAVCVERRRIADTKEKRTWVRVMAPKHFEIPGCACGNADAEWSEFKEHLWCAKCQKDFVPAHWGIFDGPVPVYASLLLGLNFDYFDLDKQALVREFEKEREELGLPKTKYQKSVEGKSSDSEKTRMSEVLTFKDCQPDGPCICSRCEARLPKTTLIEDRKDAVIATCPKCGCKTPFAKI